MKDFFNKIGDFFKGGFMDFLKRDVNLFNWDWLRMWHIICVGLAVLIILLIVIIASAKKRKKKKKARAAVSVTAPLDAPPVFSGKKDAEQPAETYPPVSIYGAEPAAAAYREEPAAPVYEKEAPPAVIYEDAPVYEEVVTQRQEEPAPVIATKAEKPAAKPAAKPKAPAAAKTKAEPAKKPAAKPAPAAKKAKEPKTAEAAVRGKYVIEFTRNGKYRFALLANNGNRLFESEEYSGEASCRNGITNFKKYITETNKDVVEAGNGKFQYVIKRPNGSYTSKEYDTEEKAKSAAVSVQRFGETENVIVIK